MSPEMLNDKNYGPTVDIWGLGVLLYELATGVPPFYASSIQQLLKLIINPLTPINYPSTMSNTLISFLQLLLVREPHLRANWDTIIKHPFLQLSSSSSSSSDGTTLTTGIPPSTQISHPVITTTNTH